MQPVSQPPIPGGGNPKRGAVSWFASYYKPHLRLFVLDMICASVIALVDLAFPIATKYALETFLPNDLFTLFFALVGSLFVGYVVRAVMYYVVTYYGHDMGVRIEADMRGDLFSHIQKLSFGFFDKTRTGQLMSRVTNDLFDVTELAHHGPEDLFISLITLIGAFIILVRIQWVLAVAIFVLIPVMVFLTWILRKRLRRASLLVRERMAGINTELESSLSGIRVAKAFANEDYELTRFGEGNTRFKSAKGEHYKAMAVFHSVMEFMLALISLTVIGVGGVLIMQGKLNYIELITFTLYVGTFVQPIRRLVNFTEQYTTGMAGFSRFIELMSIDPDIRDAPHARALGQVRGDIEFKDVTFSYDENVSVLEHLSLKIPAGSTLALVGPSGGGKTTLCHLIPRFYDVTEGEILLDGTELKDIQLRSLRQNIGIVQQDVFLFAGTIRDNIRYGRTEASDEEIVEAAKMAEIHEDILAMPDGYDSQIGERGVTLSGGQKQRVSIARIFLKNPPILILDEATSALDTHTEARIQRAFDLLSVGRTTLVIAHRLSTVRGADMIVVIGDVGILEQGTHAELLEKGGFYASLYQAQFRTT